jgi:hypothetical protein
MYIDTENVDVNRNLNLIPEDVQLFDKVDRKEQKIRKLTITCTRSSHNAVRIPKRLFICSTKNK